MILRGTSEVLPDGHLAVGGCDTVQLARRFGTPLWVLDEEAFRGNCREFLEAFSPDLFPGGVEVVYASKALLTLAVCRLVHEEGLWLDVVSGGELHTARVAGFPMERVLFHGNNKSAEEIRMALDLGVGRLMVDNFHELDLLGSLVSERRREGASRGRREAASGGPHVVLRLTPGIEAATHDYIRTGQTDSKFGFPIETGQAFRAVQQALETEGIRLLGIHCHLGSQIRDTGVYALAADALLDFAAETRARTGWWPEELNLGGGFAVRYTADEEAPPAPVDYARAVAEVVADKTVRLGLPAPRVLVEPGRAVAAAAGWTRYAVGT
ncbi:MAG TPA: diaminopimelate decarboxylase, partial [Clostridiales bacterium]|nr:diaminopimelate decarboxylase [Clostridiales bacterium]